MKNKILSIIGIVWGGGIILNWLFSDSSTENGASQAGGFVALLMGFALLGFSIYNFRKKPKDKN